LTCEPLPPESVAGEPYHEKVPFDLAPYSEEVRDILRLDGAGERLMPLVAGPTSSAEAASRISRASAGVLFPGGRSPQGALAGFWLYFSAFEPSHTVSQALETAEGFYWHAILHRQEPDPGNAGYWFRRVGRHPVFASLHQAALALGYPAGAAWDPYRFIEYCDEARRRPGSPQESLAREVQLAEWQLLFEYCALPVRR
jgi:hypothetical protein